jgi:hypothetical protein
MMIKVRLLQKVGATYVLVASRIVKVRGVKDRDGERIRDGAYVATFARPKPGSYEFAVRYAGSASYKPCAKTLKFTL